MGVYIALVFRRIGVRGAGKAGGLEIGLFDYLREGYLQAYQPKIGFAQELAIASLKFVNSYLK
ncbi:hypothetical protein H6G18_03420 [Anabaena subtropica FACHB-260]|uniref:Uncharacterized protein n=1 Tax=Anabaena subtropica FACHB-260 TaxID=2692884 RepID=A0ABR8CKX0_9NOST|nr:hypothetical protein [Anabaena subtropica FACHB-260]